MGSFFGVSPQAITVRTLIERYGKQRNPVFIAGETGTGKELIASAIHAASSRAGEKFVALNCAALPEDLLESELFGHERGAFTGAVAEKKGLFEAADRGTLFLDEMGELPLSVQAKLLRALQEGKIRRVGATSEKAVDVRIICATNRDLAAEVLAGRFREDLYHRIAVLVLPVPPLRDRRTDIIPLFERFLPGRQLDDDAKRRLERHHFRGNVRELQNIVARILACPGDGTPISEGVVRDAIADGLLEAFPETPRASTNAAPPVSIAEQLLQHTSELHDRKLSGSLHKKMSLAWDALQEQQRTQLRAALDSADARDEAWDRFRDKNKDNYVQTNVARFLDQSLRPDAQRAALSGWYVGSHDTSYRTDHIERIMELTDGATRTSVTVDVLSRTGGIGVSTEILTLLNAVLEGQITCLTGRILLQGGLPPGFLVEVIARLAAQQDLLEVNRLDLWIKQAPQTYPLHGNILRVYRVGAKQGASEDDWAGTRDSLRAGTRTDGSIKDVYVGIGAQGPASDFYLHVGARDLETPGAARLVETVRSTFDDGWARGKELMCLRTQVGKARASPPPERSAD